MRKIGVHAQRAARTAVRIRRDSSGMLRSVRASGAWTGPRDTIHDMWAEGVESYVESYVHLRVSHGVSFIRGDQGLLWAVKQTKM